MQSKEGSVKINAVKNAQYDFLLIEGPGLVKVSIFHSVLLTVFKNHRKSLIEHCERSELRLHFEWTKVDSKCQK